MELIEFKEVNVTFAKNQPEYRPLPAHCVADAQGTTICCWQLSWWERIKVLCSGRIWHSILTFNQKLQPQKLTVEKPPMDKAESGTRLWKQKYDEEKAA